MGKKQNRALGAVVFLVAGIALLLINNYLTDILAGISFGIGFMLFVRCYRIWRGDSAAAPFPEPTRPTGNLLHDKAEPYIPEEDTIIHETPLGSEYWKKLWMQTENTVDELLDAFITTIDAKIPSYCTIAIFFPATDGSYALRRCTSKTDFVDRSASIIPRRGILGSLVADGLHPFYEPNFTNKNATLYYYNEKYGSGPDEKIRSIMLCPIQADGQSKGVLLADSTKADAFSQDEQAFFENIANIMGQAIYYTYLSTKYEINFQRLAAMADIGKAFWNNLERDTILDIISDVIPNMIPCGRFTISLRDANKAAASIVRAHGEESEGFLGLKFQLSSDNSSSIANLAYSNNFGFFRNFNEEHYEYRYSENEPKSRGFASFMVVPFGQDEISKKPTGLIFIESSRKDAFSPFNVQLLSNMGESAGVALEKIAIIEKANKLATHDALTGIYNRRQFMKILTAKISAYERYKEPVSLAICDIDFFKKLNDTYGHGFGDEVIKGVAAKLNNSVRVDIDAAARYGGEEFVLIFDKTCPEKAKEMVERIRQGIEDMRFVTAQGEEVKTTMSFGIASYPVHARELNKLIHNADKALYDAKANGRNRVEVY
ncbi:MAG: sensor domain-containing diguanylate cyclase [Chitinispirillales bacterium]|jgi:diguanylate cyclase (GGDEF)-like protein|nr:sensor domain-containing diguanylate cyclase [Chitinispirillales bacterium]